MYAVVRKINYEGGRMKDEMIYCGALHSILLPS